MVQLDAIIDATVEGVELRFPGVQGVESLPYLGRDRRIRRGRLETDEVYGARLRRWLDDHATRGGPFALLAQLAAHFAPANFQIDLVYMSGRRFSQAVDGTITRSDITWAPDPDAAKWARWWLFYDWPTPIPSDGLWGDAGIYGDAGVWGSGLTQDEVTDLRLVPKEWNAAHAFGTVVLLPDGAELWGFPVGTWGDPGTWGDADPVVLAVGG